MLYTSNFWKCAESAQEKIFLEGKNGCTKPFFEDRVLEPSRIQALENANVIPICPFTECKIKLKNIGEILGQMFKLSYSEDF